MNISKRYKRAGLVLVTLSLVMGITACGSQRMHHRGPNPERALKRATKVLDLSGPQQAKLKTILEEMQNFKSDMRASHADMITPLKANLAQEQLNLEQLNLDFDIAEKELSIFRKTLLSQFADFHASLDESQRTELVSIMEKMEKHHKR